MKIENSQPQIDYTKINKDIADYVINSIRSVFKIFPKEERGKALVVVEQYFTDQFLVKFGADVLYNSIIYANFVVSVDCIELEIENKRLRKLINKKPPK